MLNLKSQQIRFLAEKIPVKFLLLNNILKKSPYLEKIETYLLLFFHINLPLAWASSVRHFTPSKPDVILSEGEGGGGAKS